MRIATLANASVVHTRRWVEHLRSRGHAVALFSLEPAADGLEADLLPRAPLPDFARYPLALAALERRLAGFAPDLIDAHFVPNYGWLGALSGFRPLVVTAWGSDLLVSGSRGPLEAARARFVLSRARLVLVDSENLAVAARSLGAPADRVRVVPWGVEIARFAPGLTREPGLLFSTRLHEPVYDLPTLLQGVRPLLRERADVRLLIAGDGSQTAALERLAAELLPAGRYAFVGRLSQAALAEWFSRAALYVSASRSDSTSVSLLEAMASGAIPVVSDLEGNREWVAEGRGARLFRPGDPDDLTRALKRALADPDWAEAARARNRRVIEERADAAVTMRRIEAWFEALVSGRDPVGTGPAMERR